MSPGSGIKRWDQRNSWSARFKQQGSPVPHQKGAAACPFIFQGASAASKACDDDLAHFAAGCDAGYHPPRFGVVHQCTRALGGQAKNFREGVTGSIFAAVGTALAETMVPILALIAGMKNAAVSMGPARESMGRG
jgi:hypothetical protein